ncbi:portal protein, partial [Bacillus wiedmannii]
LKSLDIAFDSFQREFVLGKKRIIVPASAIKYVTDPISGQQQRYFDASDEVYEAMKFEENQEIKDISVELRVEEHKAAINALLNYYSMQTGFST